MIVNKQVVESMEALTLDILSCGARKEDVLEYNR